MPAYRHVTFQKTTVLVGKPTRDYPRTHVAAVVDEPREVAALGRVDDGLQVDPEEVRAADAGRLVLGLPEVGHARPDHLPDVLDDHLVRRDRLHGEEAPVVDAGLGELEVFPPEFQLVELQQVRVGVRPECRQEPALVRAGLPRQSWKLWFCWVFLADLFLGVLFCYYFTNKIQTQNVNTFRFG